MVVVGKICWNIASVLGFSQFTCDLHQYRCCINGLFWFHHAQFEISTSYYTPMWPISKKSTFFGHHSNFIWLLSIMVVGLGIVPSLTVKGHLGLSLAYGKQPNAFGIYFSQFCERFGFEITGNCAMFNCWVLHNYFIIFVYRFLSTCNLPVCGSIM